MAQELQFIVKQQQVDVSGNVSNEQEYQLSAYFSSYDKKTFELESGNIWTSISYGVIQNSVVLKIITDKSITYRLNGGSEEFSIDSSFILIGETTELEIKNNSGETATIIIEIYGA